MDNVVLIHINGEIATVNHFFGIAEVVAIKNRQIAAVNGNASAWNQAQNRNRSNHPPANEEKVGPRGKSFRVCSLNMPEGKRKGG